MRYSLQYCTFHFLLEWLSAAGGCTPAASPRLDNAWCSARHPPRVRLHVFGTVVHAAWGGQRGG
jgi:hypothetical protein